VAELCHTSLAGGGVESNWTVSYRFDRDPSLRSGFQKKRRSDRDPSPAKNAEFGISEKAQLRGQEPKAKSQQPLFSIQLPQPFLINIHGHASSYGQGAHSGDDVRRVKEMRQRPGDEAAEGRQSEKGR